jgi:hypothetical protein
MESFRRSTPIRLPPLSETPTVANLSSNAVGPLSPCIPGNVNFKQRFLISQFYTNVKYFFANEKKLLPNPGEGIKILTLPSAHSEIPALPFDQGEDPVMPSDFSARALRRVFSQPTLADASPIREFGVSNSEPEP